MQDHRVSLGRRLNAWHDLAQRRHEFGRTMTTVFEMAESQLAEELGKAGRTKWGPITYYRLPNGLIGTTLPT